MKIDAQKILEEHNGVFIREDCLFVSTTGALLSSYVNCEVVFPHYQIMTSLVEELIAPFYDLGVEAFACPATGDIVLAQYATIQANVKGFATTAVWADKQSEGRYAIERNGFPQAIAGKKVAVLNDRIATGGTTKKLIDEVRHHGGDILGVATLAGTSKISAEKLDVPFVNALCKIDPEVHQLDALPESWENLPIVADEALGHGAAFQKKHGDSWLGGYTNLMV